MTTKLLNWASNEGQITKSKLSGGRRAKFLPWLVVMIYNLLRTEGYLGNVGLVCPRGADVRHRDHLTLHLAAVYLSWV